MSSKRMNAFNQVKQGRESPFDSIPPLPTDEVAEEKWPLERGETWDDSPLARLPVVHRWGRMDRSA